VDIDHIRPEILPADRGDEIRRLADGGATVAVLGRSPNDDDALSAADVSVALDSAGASAAEWAIQLAFDDVRDAAFALRVAHACRKEAWIGLVWAVGPGTAATLLMALSLLPTPVPPLAALAGSLVAITALRARK
jgi:Cu+-exporting ATPase